MEGDLLSSEMATVVSGYGEVVSRLSGGQENASSILAILTELWAVSDNGSTSALHAEGSGSIPLRST